MSDRHKTRVVEKIWETKEAEAGAGKLGMWGAPMRVFTWIPVSTKSVPFAVRVLRQISAGGV